jgi:hypothetical protein
MSIVVNENRKAIWVKDPDGTIREIKKATA